MSRSALINALAAHKSWDEQEEGMLRQMQNFVAEVPDCFERSHLAGHLTASAWIVDPDRKQVLLLLHRKLGLWLQPGGHADGDTDLLAVAQREALEETGLKVEPVSADIYDVDVHRIPEHKGVPAHFHYDVRYLFSASPSASLSINSESRELAWIPLSELAGYNDDRSVIRLAEKLNEYEQA